MPPVEGLNAVDSEFVLQVLRHIKDDGTVDWNGVAANSSMSWGRNATAKFQRIASRFGFKYHNGRVVKDDDAGNNVPTTSAAPSAPTRFARSGAGSAIGSSSKKRKAQEESEDDD